MGILDNTKEIANAVHEMKNLELYGRILNLHSDIMGMVEENDRLRQENAALKKRFEIKDKLIIKEHNYYLPMEEGKEDGPFCTLCFDMDGKLIRMKWMSSPWSVMGVQCPYCTTARRR